MTRIFTIFLFTFFTLFLCSRLVLALEPSLSDQDYALILLLEHSKATPLEVREVVEKAGGRIALIFPPRVLTGWIPPEVEGKLEKEPGIESILRSTVPFEVLQSAQGSLRAGLEFFSSFLESTSRSRRVPISAEERNPLINDAWEHREPDWWSVMKNLEKMPSLSPFIAQGNSDDMMGTVAVTLFFVESDGTMDPNVYTWSDAAYQEILTKAALGLNWWAGQASNYGRALSFLITDFPPTDPRCQTGYEPIIHASWEAADWISEIMGKFGYTSGSDISRVWAYNTWSRAHYGTNWAYSAFVEFNGPGANMSFSDGYAAWAYWGGPYTNLLFRSFGESFDIVFAHESAHIFWACDEYYEPGYGGCMDCGPCSDGFYNKNCEYCNPQAVRCMMRNNSWELCDFTPGHVGWLSTPLAKYYRHSIGDSSGNDNGAADPGETVSLSVVIKNYGTPISSVSATLSTSDSAVTVLSSYSQFPNLGTGETGTSLDPYTFRVADWVTSGSAVTFNLQIAAASYESTSTFQIGIGFPPILLVDDDGGLSYETYYKNALNALGIPPREWKVLSAGTPPFSELKWYRAVIWFTSFDSEFTLNGNDERALEEYLNAGGTLLFSSQDYLGERFEYFAKNYLHASSVNLDAQSTFEAGLEGDPISSGLNLSMSYPFTNYSDDIVPDSRAAPVFMNSSGNPGGLRFPEVGTAPYKVVFLAFPFEAIANGSYPNTRTEVMKRLVAWLLSPQDLQPPLVSLVSPIGGERWEAGIVQNIDWTASDASGIDSLSIFLSSDGGLTFPDTITSSYPNNPPFLWAAFASPSESCVVKVVAYDRWLNSSYDLSDSLFTIWSSTQVDKGEGKDNEARRTVNLFQNYPNPFDPSTSISFSIPHDAGVSLHVFDANGRLVRKLLDGKVLKGPHSVTWDGADERGMNLPNGIYLIKLMSEHGTAVRKIVLLK